MSVSNQQIGIGLIGVGRHGRRYLDHLRTDVPGAGVVAVCRKRTGLPATGALAGLSLYADYRELIADPLVQAVVVVTAPALCPEICLAAAAAGKPILIEKPLANSGAEARAMVAAAERAGVLLMTAQTMRFDATVLSAKAQLPAIGRLRLVDLVNHVDSAASIASRSSGTAVPGALLEIGVHLLDLVRFFTGEEVAQVECRLDRPDGAVEAAARAVLHTADGAVCSIDAARVDTGRIGTMQWEGTEGTVTADWVRRTVTCRIGGGRPRQWTVEPAPTIVAVLRAFLYAIRTNTQPPVSGVDGCRAVELADACYRSAALGGTAVSVQEFP
ncbi:Gfo/Idh/MocA family protein [Nitrospira japonica]|nr:Gfo/Idh/MocA family oxidoreductase [Nitrospira japonica]